MYFITIVIIKKANNRKYFIFSIVHFLFFYSVLNASTGSFLLAIFAGISPAIIVKIILIITNITPAFAGTTAFTLTPVIACIPALIGIVNNTVIPIPSNPEISPTINVSALNTLDISFFEAPIALNIPISFVHSNTDIYVIIPIIIDDTIREIATNAINT